MLSVKYLLAHRHARQASQQPQRFWETPTRYFPVTEADEYELFPFEPITLAYEVDLKLVGERHFHREVEQVTVEYMETRGGRTTIRKATTETTTETTEPGFKHLILDLMSTPNLRLTYHSSSDASLADAHYIDRLSDVAALEGGGDFTERESIRSRPTSPYISPPLSA